MEPQAADRGSFGEQRREGAAAADRLIAVVKRDCPTCRLVAPVLAALSTGTTRLRILSQDDPAFPEGLDVEHDEDLLASHRLGIEVVPTLLRLEGDREAGRSIGWHREEWRSIAGDPTLGEDLPPARPGCGALNVEPQHAERLARLVGAGPALRSRGVELGDGEDPFEACFARGWTDGLPVVPPEPERVARMIAGTNRPPQDVVGLVAPDLVPCTVEKVAVNAVMAGCLPEYLPVVLACVEAACAEEFNWHGLAATTYFSGPVVVVNGPVCGRLGMNSGMNALGQGNRANLTIGRALQLTLRNVGGARPGELDRATLGNPGKLSFCFAEDEDGSPWESLAVERGAPPDASAVTLFAGEGPRGVIDQQSRTPESLACSLASALRSVAHPKLVLAFDAMVVVAPEHARVFREAGWSKARLRQEIQALLTTPASELLRGAGGCAEGVPAAAFPGPEEVKLPKFRPDGLLFVHAGGKAGLFSAILGGWINGPGGSQPVTRVVRE
ncbi:MAG TPA: thioredoxin family protein [Thermoanaerobaculia bacterium]|nr:thioredoxin family protein [Thermoanaerobaculia bacterium]